MSSAISRSARPCLSTRTGVVPCSWDSALLSLDSVRRSRTESVASETERCVALLVDMGLVDAARGLAQAVGANRPGDQVRVLAVRGRESDVLVSVVRRWCSGVLAVRVDRHTAWAVVPDHHPAVGCLRAALAGADAESSAVLSELVAVEGASRVRGLTTVALSGLPPGTRLLTPRSAGPYDADLAARLGAAVDGLRPPLRDALVAYVRHRGQWEAAARAIGVHRNTIRHRIERCGEILDVDLTDPDVTAELWLTLRRKGCA